MYLDEICKKGIPRLGFVISALSSLGRGRKDGVGEGGGGKGGDVERITNEQMKTRFLVGGRRGFFCCCCLWEIYTAAAAAAAVRSRSGI